jgi:hypothetical protein
LEAKRTDKNDATFHPGNHVASRGSQGKIKGTLEKKLTTPARIKTPEVKASKHNPDEERH